MDLESIFALFQNAEDFEDSDDPHEDMYQSICESMCMCGTPVDLPYSQFRTLTERLMPILKNFNVNVIHLFHNNKVIHKINGIVLSIGIDNLLQLYLIYDHLLMNMDYFNKLSKILISYLNFNEHIYRSCHEKIRFLLNNAYKNEIVIHLYLYTTDYFTHYKEVTEKYRKIKDETIKNRLLTKDEHDLIKKKIGQHEYTTSDYYFAGFNEETDAMNQTEYASDDKINKVEYVIRKFCIERNSKNRYFLPHPDELQILYGLIYNYDYFNSMEKLKKEININNYDLYEINRQNDNMDLMLITMNRFMRDKTVFHDKKTIKYLELAGGSIQSLNLVKQIATHYNLYNQYRFPTEIKFKELSKEVQDYLVGIKFCLSEEKFNSMTTLEQFVFLERVNNKFGDPTIKYNTPEQVNNYINSIFNQVYRAQGNGFCYKTSR